MMRKKVLVIEDEVLIARDIKSKLRKLDFDVTGIVYNSDQATDAIVTQQPDLILLDINIQGSRNGIELAHIINRDFNLPFIFVTSYSDHQTIKEVQLTAPAGYIVKPFDLNDLRVELEMAFFRLQQKVRLDFPDHSLLNSKTLKPFSAKEYEILLDIKEGLNNPELAAKHYVSVNTIKSHVKNIYLKCAVHNRVELMNFCFATLKQ